MTSEHTTEEAKMKGPAVTARALAGMLRSRIERAAEHKFETVSLGQFFADQIHRYLTEAGYGPEHDARAGDVPADDGDPDRDRGRDWGLRARQVHLEGLSRRAAGGKWFASTNGAGGLARIDNGTDAMFPVRCEWHEAEFIEALVNAYRNRDLVAPRTDSAESTAGKFRFTTNELREIREAILELGKGAIRTQKITDHQAASDIQRHCIHRIERALASRSATPAPSSPGVPDSLWALLGKAHNALHSVKGALDEAGRREKVPGRSLKLYGAAEECERAIFSIADVLSAHPAGQSDDGAERCIACDKPLKAGERVLPDTEGGTIHTACCGPEREGYTKGDGEPLGPNDPIPQGYVYEPERPARQRTGQGAYRTGLPEANDAFKAAAKQYDAAMAQAGARDGAALEGMLDLLCRFYGYEGNHRRRDVWQVVRDLVAPDSTRTGQVETFWLTGQSGYARAAEVIEAEDQIVEIGVTHEGRIDLVVHNRARDGEGGFDDLTARMSRDEAGAVVVALIEAGAARPAAPEAQGAWHWTDRDGHPVRDAEQGEQWLLTWSEGSATYDVSCIDNEWPHGEPIKLLCMDAWRWIEVSPGEPPAPPTSSGQESA